MTTTKNVEGHYYPEFHCGWGGCAEELFHYTSRYYIYTEAFLRNLSENRQFSMTDYRASDLNQAHRTLMAAVLSCPPAQQTGESIVDIVSAVCRDVEKPDPGLYERYQEQLNVIPKGATIVYSAKCCKPNLQDITPLDPFLSMAERLQLPVAVKEHHVEVSLRLMAEHLDSPNPRIRTNLQEAVLRLHDAGYLLRNHPGLTHREAKAIADEDAV